MTHLRDLEVLVQAAERGSLSAAARRLEITPAAASMALRRLEDALGVPLFLRSTRSLRLTEAGQIYLEHCRQALQLLADGRDALLTGQAALRGTLHLSLPSDLGRNAVQAWLDDFLAAHPQLSLRLLLSDRLADIYRQPVDLALRYGTLPDSTLIALPVAPDNLRVPCAAPDWLARHGPPQHPQDLAGLLQAHRPAGAAAPSCHASPADALAVAQAAADPADRIVVFGSFLCVGGVLKDGVPRAHSVRGG